MRTNLLLSLTTCVLFAACADHQGELTTANAPQPPVNEPDPGAIGSSPTNPPGTVEPPGGGSTGGGTTGGGGGTQGEGGGTGTEGSNPVPEPSTLLLVGSGLACAAMLPPPSDEGSLNEGRAPRGDLEKVGQGNRVCANTAAAQGPSACRSR